MVIRVTEQKGSKPVYKRITKTATRLGPHAGEPGYLTKERKWPSPKGDRR